MDSSLTPEMNVDLALEHGWHLHCTVFSVGDQHVDLRVQEGEGTIGLPGDLRWCQGSLLWQGPEGPAVRHGVLALTDDRHSLRLHAVGFVEGDHRRDHVRVAADLPASVQVAGATVASSALDVSMGGMLLANAEGIDRSEIVKWALEIGDGSVAGDGRVVRTGDDGSAAIQFGELPPEAELALAHFVARSQREAAGA